MFEKLLALFLLIFFSPVFFILYILIKLTSQGPFFFKQLRVGKNKKPFWIYKIRTMVENAEDLKEKIKHLNQADGPVFKVYDDPRFTKIGRFLAKIGIDELPQLINIVKGQMSFVGPRPFPLDEAKKIPKKYEKRFLVLPGIFSSWVAYGAFHNDFKKWMELDLKDVENKSFWYDLKIVIRSVGFVLKLIVRSVKSSVNIV
jgi:lipopolysaccharide/colanic/teichoic acid biosynthesis glycosyltransferase